VITAEDYARSGRKSVAGWLAPESAAIVAALGRAQSAEGLRGGVGEIGIHHGKLFLLLDLLALPGERAVAIDLFGRQDLNRDASGRGDKEIFLAHFDRLGGDRAALTILEKDSTAVSAEEILAATGPLRLFSIDGGHTRAVVENDLALAERVMAAGGIVIVDDVYNEAWPEVALGTFSHLSRRDTGLRPFAISPNKLYLCADADRGARYARLLRERFAGCFWSTVRLFEADVQVFGRESWRSRLKNSPYARNPAVRAAIGLVRGPLAGVIARFQP
jgi:hypothetical protein